MNRFFYSHKNCWTKRYWIEIGQCDEESAIEANVIDWLWVMPHVLQFEIFGNRGCAFVAWWWNSLGEWILSCGWGSPHSGGAIFFRGLSNWEVLLFYLCSWSSRATSDYSSPHHFKPVVGTSKPLQVLQVEQGSSLDLKQVEPLCVISQGLVLHC